MNSRNAQNSEAKKRELSAKTPLPSPPVQSPIWRIARYPHDLSSPGRACEMAHLPARRAGVDLAEPALMKFVGVGRLSLLAFLVGLGCTADAGTAADGVAESSDSLVRGPRTSQVAIERIVGLQPGWVRVNVSFRKIESGAASFEVRHHCQDGSDDLLEPPVTTFIDQSRGRTFVDLKVNPTTGASRVCVVDTLDIRLRAGARQVASVVSNAFVPFDMPLMGLTPERAGATFGPLIGDFVTLANAGPTRRLVAYPPQLVAIHSSKTPRVALAEVEYIPERGSVAVRWMTVFAEGHAAAAENEIGGGSELLDSFGFDIDGKGIGRLPTPVEESHSGHCAFASGLWTKDFVSDPSKQVFPYPPLQTQAAYFESVLDNRSVPRVLEPQDELDVVFDESTHRLVARPGAAVQLLEHPPFRFSPVVSPVFTIPNRIVSAGLAAGAPNGPAAGVAGSPRRAELRLLGAVERALFRSNQANLVSLPDELQEARSYLSGLRSSPLRASLAPAVPIPISPKKEPIPSRRQFRFCRRATRTGSPPPRYSRFRQINTPIRSPIMVRTRIRLYRPTRHRIWPST